MTTADPQSDLRRRVAAEGKLANKSDSSVQQSKRPAKSQSSSSFGIVELLRFVAGAALLSTLGSYLVTRGESLVWGVKRPWWTDPSQIQQWQKGPLLLTNAELAAYDGSDPSKPVLVALNRTIYDVSASAAVYGHGGPYSALAAKDASRSYITTCFDPVDDLVPYFGGVEEVYVPLWLSKNPSKEELDAVASGEIMNGMDIRQIIDTLQKKIGRKRTRLMREEAYAKAKERVAAQVKTWEGMFERKNYPIVGRVVGVDEKDEKLWKKLKFCKAATDQRPPLAESLVAALDDMGKPIDISKMASGFAKMAKDGVAGGAVKAGAAKAAGKLNDKAADAAATKAAEDAIKGGKDLKQPFNKHADARIEDLIKSGKQGEMGTQKRLMEQKNEQKQKAQAAKGKAL